MSGPIFSRLLIVLATASLAVASATESVPDLVNRLTSEQKQLFDQATKAFNARSYSEALGTFKQLLTQLPGDAILTKFASESALNSGETSFPIAALKPVVMADPNDWQAFALLARACAESGDVPCRDSAMSHMTDLHARGAVPRAMQAYLLERVKLGDNTLLIRTSLEPWGPYKVYVLGQVLGSDGKIFLRITLESGDGDQIQFAKEHPKEAAAGLRNFSLDAYRETGLNSAGQRTQAHYTYQFFAGQPSYDAVRQQFINVANGKSVAISSRTNLTVQ